MLKRSEINVRNTSATCLLDVGLLALARVAEFVDDPRSVLDLGVLSKGWNAKARLLVKDAELQQRVRRFQQRAASVHHVRTGDYFAIKEACRRGELRSVRWFLTVLRDDARRFNTQQDDGGWNLGFGSDSLLCDLFELACRHGHLAVAKFLCSVTSERALRTILSTPTIFSPDTMMFQRVSFRFAIKCSVHESTVGAWLDATFGLVGPARLKFLAAFHVNNFFARALCAVGRRDSSVLLASDGTLHSDLNYDDHPCFVPSDGAWHDLFIDCAINGCVDVARLLLPKMQQSLGWLVDVLTYAITRGRLSFANWLFSDLPEAADVLRDMQHVHQLFAGVCSAPLEHTTCMFDLLFDRLDQALRVELTPFFERFLQHAAVHCSANALAHMMRRIGLGFGHVLPRATVFLPRRDNDDLLFDTDVSLVDAMFLSACYGSNVDAAIWLCDARAPGASFPRMSRAMHSRENASFQSICVDLFVTQSSYLFYGDTYFVEREFDRHGEHVSERHLRFLKWAHAKFDIAGNRFTRLFTIPFVSKLCVCNYFTVGVFDWMHRNIHFDKSALEQGNAVCTLCCHDRVHELQYFQSKFGLRVSNDLRSRLTSNFHPNVTAALQFTDGLNSVEKSLP